MIRRGILRHRVISFCLLLVIGACAVEGQPQRCDGKTPPDQAGKLAKKHFDLGRAHSAGGRRSEAIDSFRAAIECRLRSSSSPSTG